MKKNGKPSKREIELSGFRFAGYHGDNAALTRKLIERRFVKREDAMAEFSVGIQQRKNGVPCGCHQCKGGAA